MSDEPKQLSAAATLAAAAAIATPAEESPKTDARDVTIETLHGELRSMGKDLEKARKRIEEVSANRDHWKKLAQKFEEQSDGLALERVTGERDGLKKEVAALSRKLIDETKAHGEIRKVLGEQLAQSMKERDELRHHLDRTQETMVQMQKARDRAGDREQEAVDERAKYALRVADLEAEVKALKAPKEPPKQEPDKKKQQDK